MQTIAKDYSDLATALEMLRSIGSLRVATPYYGPSFNEETAYNTVMANKDLLCDDILIHRPSQKILVRPKVGMGVTLHYPNDCYPYEITKLVSEQTLEIRAMNHTPVPGWVPDFSPGGFCGHFHNLHEQQFTYTSNPEGRVTRIRLNKRGNWMHKSIPYSVGEAKFFRDWND
jgi:hypothetical protein